MSSFHIIGTGCCGFLRAYQTLKNHIPLKYKGVKVNIKTVFKTGMIVD